MIDSYFDRADAAARNWRTDRDQSLQAMYDDPRYFRGSLYSTMIDRNVAEAKYNLAYFIDTAVLHHKLRLRDSFKKARA